MECEPLDLGCHAGNIGEGLEEAGKSISDPFYAIYKSLKDSASFIATKFLPTLIKVSSPDLTADWFISAYRISFTIATLAAAVLLVIGFVRLSRRTVAPSEAISLFTQGFPLFYIGAAYGPPLGMLISTLSGALTEAIAKWGIIGSLDKVGEQMNTVIGSIDPATYQGSTLIAAVLMLCMFVGITMVAIVQILQLVTLYFIGLLIPLALIWLMDPVRKWMASKMLWIWSGIEAMRPLLFFLLSASFMFIAAMTNEANKTQQNAIFNGYVNTDAKEPVWVFAQFIAAAASMLVAGFSPFLLMKFGKDILPGYSPSSPRGDRTTGKGSLHDYLPDRSSSNSRSDNSSSRSNNVQSDAGSATGSQNGPSSPTTTQYEHSSTSPTMDRGLQPGVQGSSPAPASTPASTPKTTGGAAGAEAGAAGGEAAGAGAAGGGGAAAGGAAAGAAAGAAVAAVAIGKATVQGAHKAGDVVTKEVEG